MTGTSAMPGFWDASAIVPLCIPGPGGNRWRKLLHEHPPVVWWGTRVEIASAIQRLGREALLTAVQQDAAHERLSMLGRDRESAIRLHDLQLDYVRATYPERDALNLIRGAFRLSSHVIESNPAQFASQLTGPLLPHREEPAIGRFCNRIAAAAPAPWLRPLHPAPHPPGTGLVRTLEGHSGSVNGVAVTPDGRRAVSASDDRMLKVWDLKTGLPVANIPL